MCILNKYCWYKWKYIHTLIDIVINTEKSMDDALRRWIAEIG